MHYSESLMKVSLNASFFPLLYQRSELLEFPVLADAEVCFGMLGFQVVKAKRLCRDFDIQADFLDVGVTAFAHVFFKLNDCLSHVDILLCRPLVRTRGELL